MKDDWSDPAFAGKWDTVTSQKNEIRKEQLNILTSIVADSYSAGTLVLDIGCGSGQVEEMIVTKRPDIKIVGFDSSESMLELAQQRQHNFPNNFDFFKKDIASFENADLPEGIYQTCFTVQVLHELNPQARQDLFKKVHEILKPGGQFLVMDRIQADFDTFGESYGSVWRRMGTAHSPLKSVSEFEEYKKMLKEKEDDPGSVEEYEMLFKDTGFSFAILHLYFDRALMVGVKG